ncbi:polysaccharide pyruvyl transferase CsaB [Abyssisolibacter fermentans]|uniref:polysaccharide pyruvyl transferase CsaB n=1 Tax=Abyssisolibacter fermentans TaxID=1766203 RepID=UPI00082D6845|nr:polysaccharide pyruvyl transferase CsaB [Abyssisolibacter fermentans]
MNKGKKILISGYYGFKNSGDDAILKAIVNEFKKIDNTLELTVLSKDPQNTTELYGIRAVDRFSINSIFREIKNSDLLISGGGSLIQDITSTKSILYYLSLLKLAKLMNKPVMVYANGIGPIIKGVNRMLSKNVLNTVDMITLRDYDSLNTLKDLNVKNNNIHVTADPVYALKEVDDNRINQILKLEGIDRSKKIIGLSLRKWKNYNNAEEFAKTVDYINDNYDVEVLLIPMHFPIDLSFCKDIKNHTKTKCYILEHEYSVEEIMGIIKKLELIIAMRLHSLIYAATQTTPMIAVAYDPKVEGFMNNIGLTYKIDIQNMNYTELAALFDDVWNNKKEIRCQLEKHREEFRKKSHMNVEFAMSLLK